MRIMSDLNADQLDAIRRLLVEPLRETIRQELRLTHQRLASTIEKLDERMAGRIAHHDRRLMAVERSTIQFRTFRHRIVAVYGALTVILSIGWSVVRDKLLSHFTRP
jgi:hypothetical protein